MKHTLQRPSFKAGPEAQQLTTYIGWKLHGKRGGLVAGTLFVPPSMFIPLALSVVYVRFDSLPWIAAMFDGLKTVVLALIFLPVHSFISYLAERFSSTYSLPPQCCDQLAGITANSLRLVCV